MPCLTCGTRCAAPLFSSTCKCSLWRSECEYQYRVLNFLDGGRSTGYCAGEETLLSEKKESADRPGINIAVGDDGALVCLLGRIDMDSSPAVRDSVLPLLQAAHRKRVSIDLSAVTHIDTSGIATLIEALKIARGNKTELRLQGLHDQLLRLFECTGMLSLFNGSI